MTRKRYLSHAGTPRKVKLPLVVMMKRKVKLSLIAMMKIIRQTLNAERPARCDLFAALGLLQSCCLFNEDRVASAQRGIFDNCCCKQKLKFFYM